MNKELKLKVNEWKSLERMTLEQRKKADEFYDTNLMGLIEEEFVRNNKNAVREKVEHMVVSVGTSYEPIVLNLSLFRPKQILFLYTDRSEPTLNKVVSHCDLEAGQYEKRIVDNVDPVDIYREIKRIYLKWNNPKTMYVDFTGGTKSMSAACALAAAMIDIQMIYISTEDYLTDFRKPNPGTERLTYIDNPLAVFGDLEMNKAMELFERFNFAGAGKRLEILKDKIPDAEIRQQLEFVYLLARAYEYWDALDFRPACSYMEKLSMELHRDSKYHPEYLLIDFISQVDEQYKLLQELQHIPQLQKEKRRREILEKDDIIHALMLTMLMNAKTRELQGKLDMATLLFYRLLEMIEQRRLIHYGLFASEPDYKNVRVDPKQLQEMDGKNGADRLALLKSRVQTLKYDLFHNADSYLPSQIALLDGFIILAALNDPLTEGKDHQPLRMLQRIRQMVYYRNNSIFAHGLGPVSEEDYSKFRDFVCELFLQFCQIEGILYGKKAKNLWWIQPKDSRNYLTGWEM